jgi:hypothetical protein
MGVTQQTMETKFVQVKEGSFILFITTVFLSAANISLQVNQSYLQCLLSQG